MQHAITGQAAFGALGPMADRPEGRLNRIAGPNALPMLGGEGIEGHQLLLVLVQADGCFLAPSLMRLDEQVEGRYRWQGREHSSHVT